MLSLSYTLSSGLVDTLQKIENLRRLILLTPISPKRKLLHRWEAMVGKIYWALSFSGSPLSKKEMLDLLTSQKKKQLKSSEAEVLNYRKALDYIYQNWLANDNEVKIQTVNNLHDIVKKNTADTLKMEEFGKALQFIQAGRENPVIQAAIAQYEMARISPFTEANNLTAILLALLFLYKKGYDFRGFLVLEEYWRKDITSYRHVFEESVGTNNLTSWLEYFANGFFSQAEKIKRKISDPGRESVMPASFWKLNDRQQAILAYLENPEGRITNKKVQQMFKVSQITASRDLGQLANLGLLFSYGKGRSVYYMKV